MFHFKGITFDEELSWVRHVNLQLAKGYGKLKHARRFKNFLNISSKTVLTETYILSQFNYGDVILQNLSEHLKHKIQKLQNDCVRFVHGLRKYDHISWLIKDQKILNMQNRRFLHGLTLMHRINKGYAPNYLCNRIVRHSETHEYFTRHRLNIVPAFARSKLRSMSFFIFTSRKYNELIANSELLNVSPGTFKVHCKSYLLSAQ